ncbi:hypothetical protein G6F68_014565 [Rhizopus microsporus]|nr:hypothetical protein G6F68_014565 [Rhizopus microsporus]
MIEGRKLVRYDVRRAAIIAPGGGKVGMTLGELQVLYPERADVGPDKYDEKAQHLRVRPAQEGDAVIDFALGADGKVGAWRVGKTPQVDYNRATTAGGVLDDRHCHCLVPARPAAAGAGRGLHRQGRVRPGPALRRQPVHRRPAAAWGDHLVAGTGGQRAGVGGRPTRVGIG